MNFFGMNFYLKKHYSSTYLEGFCFGVLGEQEEALKFVYSSHTHLAFHLPRKGVWGPNSPFYRLGKPKAQRSHPHPGRRAALLVMTVMVIKRLHLALAGLAVHYFPSFFRACCPPGSKRDPIKIAVGLALPGPGLQPPCLPWE